MLLGILLISSFTWTTVMSEDPYLLVVTGRGSSIEKLSLTTGVISTFKDGFRSVSLLANDYDDQLLFYSNESAIWKVSLTNPDNVTVVMPVYYVTNLGVDPEANRIYWTDSVADGIIYSCDYGGANYRKVVLKEMTRIYYLVVTNSGFIYTEGKRQEIKMVDKEGKTSQVIVKRGSPTDIVFDASRQTLYWNDRNNGIMMKSQDSDETNLAIIGFRPTYSVKLAVYGDHLYISEYIESVVYRVNKVTGESRTLVMNVTLPVYMTVVAPTGQNVMPLPKLRLSSEGGTYQFICSLQLDEDSEDEYRVRWIAGSEVLKSENVTENTTVLHVDDVILKTLVGSSLVCAVSKMEIVDEELEFGPEVISPAFKAEAKITSSLAMEVEEGGEDAEIHVELNAPPVFFGEEKLILDVELEYRDGDEIWTRDRKMVIDQILVRGRMNQDGQYTTEILVDNKNWSDDHTFNLIATPDGVQDGDKKRKVFVKLVRPSEKKRRKRSTKVEDIAIVEIKAKDKDKAGSLCTVVNDPHLTTFANTRYDNHFEGEFVLFENSIAKVQINIVLAKCVIFGLPGAACTCGVAIRNGPDRIIFNRCLPKDGDSKVKYEWNAIPIHIYYFQKESPSTKISWDLQSRYTITLRHGGKVTVTSAHVRFLQVQYKPSGADRFLGIIRPRGLCGGNNNRYREDLLMRDGSAAAIRESKFAGYYLSDDFSKDWRAREGEKLFQRAELTDLLDPRYNIICSVSRKGRKKCSDAYNVFNFFDIVHVLETKWVKPQPAVVSEVRRRKKRSVRDGHKFDPAAPLDIDENAEPRNATWPTPSGRTEDEARKFCTEAIFGDKAVKLCSKLKTDKYNAEIENCVSDVGLTDDLSWVNSTIAGIRQSCVTYKDSLDNTAPAGAAPPPLPNGVNETELMDSLCLNDCSKRGDCRDAVCHCDAGYVGADCSMKLTDPPEVISVLYGNLCDVEEMSCDGAFIFGDKFHNRTTLTCHLQKYQLGTPLPDVDFEVVKVSARYLMRDQVFCPIPHGEPHLIRISNDGQHPHHKRLFYFSYNSTCQDCQMGDEIIDTTCEMEPRTCLIGDLCVMDGTPHPSQSQLVCDSSIDNSDWSERNLIDVERWNTTDVSITTRDSINVEDELATSTNDVDELATSPITDVLATLSVTEELPTSSSADVSTSTTDLLATSPTTDVLGKTPIIDVSLMEEEDEENTDTGSGETSPDIP